MELVGITLGSQRPQAQRALYAGRLGLEAIGDDPLRVRIGTTTIAFAAGAWSAQHFAVRIPSRAYADAVAWLRSRVDLLADADGGTTFAFPDWNADAVYFRDADGNVVELIAHHDMPELYKPPFGPGSMLGVCEMGMPVDDVGAYLDRLEDAAGARRWSGDRSSFAAAGDKHGSLIVVPRGRAWYPTADARAESGPVRIELAGGIVLT